MPRLRHARRPPAYDRPPACAARRCCSSSRPARGCNVQRSRERVCQQATTAEAPTNSTDTHIQSHRVPARAPPLPLHFPHEVPPERTTRTLRAAHIHVRPTSGRNPQHTHARATDTLQRERTIPRETSDKPALVASKCHLITHYETRCTSASAPIQCGRGAGPPVPSAFATAGGARARLSHAAPASAAAHATRTRGRALSPPPPGAAPSSPLLARPQR